MLIDGKNSGKEERSEFYLTTPIYYINSEPTVGTAYTTIVADIIARFQRLKGKDVFFLTGLDENSQKSVEAARKAGEDVEEYVDEMAEKWLSIFKKLGFTFTDFIRTTEERHKKAVVDFYTRVLNKGDIYKGKYIGYYCVGCEAFKTKFELVDGKCPVHKKVPELIEEENYFFRASKYKQKLLDHINSNSDFIQPVSRRNEIIAYIKEAFDDFSISRQKQEWGIDLPNDKNQKIYVWFDALCNYLTAVGFGTDEKKFKKYWPADLHLVGKDIIKFHCAYWPAMLFSAGIELPKKVFAHGFFTVNGEKISKSLGNAIDPLEIVKKYSLDSLRYFLVREIPFGEDGDFSEKKLIERNNGELVANIGNFIHRTLTFVHSQFDGKIPKAGKFDADDKELEKRINLLPNEVGDHVEKLEFDKALKSVLDFCSFCNQYFQKKEPWSNKESAPNTLFLCSNVVRSLSIILYPFVPNAAEKLWKQLNQDENIADANWDSAAELKLPSGFKIKKPEILFKIIEI